MPHLVYNSYSIDASKKSIESTPSPSQPVAMRRLSTFEVNVLWVPKESISLKSKILIDKTILWHQILDHIGKKGL